MATGIEEVQQEQTRENGAPQQTTTSATNIQGEIQTRIEFSSPADQQAIEDQTREEGSAEVEADMYAIPASDEALQETPETSEESAAEVTEEAGVSVESGETTDDKEDKKEGKSKKSRRKKGTKRIRIGGVEIKGRPGDEVSVPAMIRIFAGVMVDLTSSKMRIEKGDEDDSVKAVLLPGGLPSIIVMASDQLIQTAISDVVITQKKNEKAKIEGRLAGQLAFVTNGGRLLTSEENSNPVLAKNSGILASNGTGTFSENGIIIDEGGKLYKADGTFDTVSKIEINMSGIIFERSAGDGNKISETVGSVDTVINLTNTDDLKTLAEDVMRNGLRAIFGRKYTLDGEDIQILGDEDEEGGGEGSSLMDKVLDTLKDYSKDALLNGLKTFASEAFMGEGKGYKAKFKNAIKEWYQSQKDDLHDDILDKFMEKSSDIENSIESLRSILPGSVIDIIEDYYMEYFKSASETLDNMAGETEIEDKEEDEDEEDDDDLGIETEIWIFPGFLGFKLGIKPEFALSVGGNLNIEALNRHLLKMAVNAHAAGEIGLVLSVGAILGNALLSLEGELDAGGKITGGSDGGKFLEISGFTIEVVKSDGQTKLKHGEAQLSAQVKAEVSLGGSLSAGSKIVGWKKELVSGEVKTTVASFNMTGKVIKKGPLLSLSGWQLSNTTVATSILNEAKAKAIDVAFADEKNIEGIADLTQSIEDRSEQIALLDKTLATIENEIKSASAFAFSKENGAYNKAIVHDLEKLWEAYYAQIKLSEDDMKKIDVQIEENSKDPKTVKGIQEVQKCIQKRIDRKALLDKWKKDNTNDKGMLKRTRKEVLAFYSIISDNGSGYARDDAEYRQDQAEADLFSKDEMMNYEKKRIEEKKKGRRELYDEVADAAYFANSDEEFLEEYIKIRGKNKGFINHLLKHGVSLGIFSQEELRARLLTYEQTRIGELTGATPFDTLLKNAELIKNKDEVNVSVNSRIFKTDEKLWTEYVMDVSTPEDILDYENTRSRELNTSGLIEKTVDPLWRALTEIRGLKKLYDNEKDEKTKWQYKHDAEHKAIDALKKAGFVSKGYFSYDKSKEEYKSLSSEDLKEIISDYADIDYYSENVSKQKSEIAALKSTDAKKVKAALEKSGNRKIYDQYIDHLLKEKEYSESIFSLDDIVEYEKEKQDHYEKNNDKKSADKHAERVQFLMYEQDQIKYLNAANLTGGKEAGQKETQAAMTLYFTGVRPVGHKEMNAEIGKEEDKAQWNVGMAKGYIERLKKKPPTKEVMIEALKWAASTDEAYENYSKAKISVDNKGSESAPAVFEEWKDKVGGDAEKALGSAIDKKKTDRTYDSWSKIDNWIAFIEYQLKGPEHFDRIDTIEKMISDGKSPDEIKKAYREKLGGGARFAEVLVKQPTGKLTVNRFLEFYRKTGQELKYAESGKHAERLKIIKETADFDEMVRLYNGSENAARFEQELLNDETVRKKLTREMILDYERKKADIGSTRHQARLAALDSAKDNAEAARLYKEDFNAGNGFEGANRDKAKNRAVKIATSRTGDAELQRIYEYEEKKRKFWEDAKKKYLKPVDDLKAKHEELENLVKDAAEKINKIVGDISALEEEGASVGNVKKAVTTARTSVSAANRNKGMIPELTEAHDKIDGYIAEQKKIREEIIEKNEQLIREEQEAEKKGVLTS